MTTRVYRLPGSDGMLPCAICGRQDQSVRAIFIGGAGLMTRFYRDGEVPTDREERLRFPQQNVSYPRARIEPICYDDFAWAFGAYAGHGGAVWPASDAPEPWHSLYMGMVV